MTSSWHIRTATGSDASAMSACVDAAYRHYKKRMKQTPGPMLDDYNVVAARAGSFVAERAGEIVGVLVLIAGSNRILLDNIAVQPSLQGTGLGKALLQKADDYARAQGYSSLTLYTHELMYENIAMYLRTGFIETHRIIENGFARVYMRKPLTHEAKRNEE